MNQPIFELALENDLICDEDKEILEILEDNFENSDDYLLNSNMVIITQGKYSQKF